MRELPTAKANGIEICYDTTGDPSDPTVLLVMGLGGQLIQWDPELCGLIAERGYHVVRFDNRDVGLSTHLDGAVDVFGLLASEATGSAPPAVPYLLSDMADDAIGLLDHLGVDRAHVVGVSMGGMIAQAIALGHRARVITLTSIMSTTGDPDVGHPTAEAMAALVAPPAQTREEAEDGAVRQAHVWGSPGLFDEGRLRRLAGESWGRCPAPPGVAHARRLTSRASPILLRAGSARGLPPGVEAAWGCRASRGTAATSRWASPGSWPRSWRRAAGPRGWPPSRSRRW